MSQGNGGVATAHDPVMAHSCREQAIGSTGHIGSQACTRGLLSTAGQVVVLDNLCQLQRGNAGAAKYHERTRKSVP
jgi:hypothetical protein